MFYNIKDFGAVGDGSKLDHMSIQAAIDKCSSSGGGTVVVPPGLYLCGTIHMRSNVCLLIETGGIIKGVNDSSAFPEICKTPYGNLPGQIQALIWADKVENVIITGQGIIDGGCGGPLSFEDAVNEKFRPALIFYRDCKNVKFTDITMKDPSFWTLHLMRCEDVVIHGVTISANQNRINTDGIDPDGCRNIIISDCNIKTGDDSIVIKSTEGDLCEKIVVTNCILSSKRAALKIGTEAIGDIRNITFSNCIINNSDVGLALYMKDGSTYENILFNNIIAEVTNEFPLLVDITPRYYRKPRIGKIQNIGFENIIVNGKGRCYIEGAEETPIRNLNFENITWNITGPCDVVNAVKPDGARRVEIDPERINYALNPYQFIVVNAKDSQFRNIKMYGYDNSGILDRGLFFIKGSEKITLENIRHGKTTEGIEPILITDSRDEDADA